MDSLDSSYSVVRLLAAPEKVNADDVKMLRDKFFGYATFFVTGQEAYGDSGEAVLLTGNLRGKKEDVYQKLRSGMRLLFGEKYEMLMINEPRKRGMEGGGATVAPGAELRVSFVLVRKEQLEAPPTAAWQYAVALLLVAVTGGACLELGLAAQVSRVPPDVLAYFTSADPDALEPPDLSVVVPLVENALPIAYGVFGVQVFHEVAHWLVAAQKRVRLGVPYIIPNITIGSFGSITQFKTPCPDRVSKFDVSVAGPLAGALLSSALFAGGLALSLPSTAASVGLPSLTDSLVQVPALLFQGSLLLGGVCRAVLGYDSLHVSSVSIHPMLIAGWCGLTVSALNLLPVGRLDGGRALQAAFGRTPLNVSSTLTYVLLGLGVLAGPLSLPFGLYILLLQRNVERPALNDVSSVGWQREVLLAVLLLLAAATLLPIWDGLADELGIGISTRIFG